MSLLLTSVLIQGCNVFGTTELKELKGDIEVSYATTTISVSSENLPIASSIDVTLVTRDIKGELYTFNDVNPEFFISSGSAAGRFGMVRSLGNGVYTASFTATDTGTPITFGANLRGKPIGAISKPITISSSVGVSITNDAYSYANASTASSFTLSGTCSENGKAVSISGDVTSTTATCNAGTYTKILNVSALPDGNFSIAVHHVDSDGASAHATKTFIKDTDAPSAATIATYPASLTGSTTANFTFTGVESDVAGFVCSLGSASYATCASPYTLTGLSAGSQTLHVKAIDQAGNLSTVQNYSWTIDLTGPALALGSRPNSVTRFDSAVFTWTASDSGGGSVASFECAQDNGAYSACTTPLNLSSLSTGSRSLSIRGIDSVGNTGSAITYSWIIDQTPPTVTISTAPALITNSNSATFAFSGADTGGGSVSSFECSIDSGSYTACSSPKSLTSLSAGAHSLAIRAIDTAGNTGVAATHSWTIDNSSPTVTISSQPASITHSTNASFSFSGSDTGGGVVSLYQCSINGGAYSTCTSPASYSSLSPGSRTFAVRAVDSAGNIGVAAQYSWAIDTTAPTVTLTQVPSAITYSSSATFGWSGSDTGGGAVASYECSIDSGSYTSCTSTKTYTSLGNGSHTFNVRAIDTAGNTGAAATKTWTIDASSALVSIDSGPDSITNQTSFNFTFSAGIGAGAASFECKMDFGSYAACVSPKFYTGQTAGTHTFSVRPIDGSNNPGAAVSQDFTIDTSLPTVTFTGSPVSLNNSTNASFSFSGADTGGGSVLGFECRIDGGSYSACSSPKSYSSLTQGSHTVDIRAIDTAGNTGSASSETFTVDLTGPTITITTNPGTITQSTTANFTFTAADTGGGSVDYRECSLDGAAYSTCTSPQSFTSLAPGSHTFSIRAVDTVGNTGAVETHSWIIDQTIPTVTIDSGPSSLTNSTSANFSFSGTDTGGGSIASYECKTDSGSYSSCTSPKALTGLTQGPHTFYVRSIDTAGNISLVSSSSWTIDTTAPTVTIVSGPATLVNSSSATITFSGSDTGGGAVASYECKLDSAAYGPCSTPLSLSGLSAGTHTLLVRAIDTAGNTGSTATHSWSIDTTAPTLSLTAPLGGANVFYGRAATISITWTASDSNFGATPITLFYSTDGGSNWSPIGSARSNSGSYSWTAPTTINSTTVKVKVIASDLAGNTANAQSSSSFTIDSEPPTLTSGQMSLNSGATTTNNNNIAVSLKGTDALTKITKFCLKYGTTSTPDNTDACWHAVNANPPGLTISSSLNLVNYYFLIGFAPGSYNVYAWLMDQAGNISGLSNSGAGTPGTDQASIEYRPGTPPVIVNVATYSSNAPGSPLTSSDVNIAANASAYIFWNLTDDQTLPGSPVSLSYTTDDVTYTPIVSGLSNGTNNGCTLLSGTTGCYKWTNGSPTSDYYRIRVSAQDSSSMISFGTSAPVNVSPPINILAGNTDDNFGSSATSAVFSNDRGTTADSTIRQSFVVTETGVVYMRDMNRGIVKIDPSDGILKLFIPKTGTSTGDGGPASAATLNSPARIALDYSGRLIIWDYNRIRRVDLNASPPTITTIIGGGSLTSDGVLATDYSLLASTSGSSGTTSLIPTADGRIYFKNKNSIGQGTDHFKISYYDPTNSRMGSIQLGGTGIVTSASQIVGDCTAYNFQLSASPIDGALQSILLNIRPNGTADALCPGSNSGSQSEQYVSFDPVTFQSTGATQPSQSPKPYNLGSFITGLDGEMYAAMANTSNGILKFNRATNRYVRIVGSGTSGACPDGTVATSCNIVPIDIFVNAQGKIFFNDQGVIRTVDSDNKVISLYGQSRFFGDGGKALSARFGTLPELVLRTSGEIAVYDSDFYRIREFLPGGNIQTIAGNGTNANPANNATAATSNFGVSSTVGNRITNDPSTGDIFSVRDTAISRLNRLTGKWSDLTTGSTNFTAADNLPASSISPNMSRDYMVGALTFGDGKLFYGISNSTSAQRKDVMIKAFDSTDSWRQIHVAGVSGPHAGTYSTPATTLSANANVVESSTSATYDPIASRLILLTPDNGSRVVRSFTINGYYNDIAVLTEKASAIFYRRTGGTPAEVIYYCDSTNGILRKFDFSTDQALPWPISSIKCTGRKMAWSTSRNSLIFIFQQNGLYGVAEYINP